MSATAAVFPMSFAQRRFWLLQELSPASSAYHVTGAVYLRGQLDISVIRRTLDALVTRHEVLRTTFGTVDGKPVQVIHEQVDVALSVEDDLELTDTGPERDKAIKVTLAEGLERPFDLRTDLPFRARIIRLAETVHIMQLTVHHIAADGWSMGIIIDEFTQAYGALRSGESVSLPELPVQYADFSAWQSEWLQSDALQRELDWWIAELRGMPEHLVLPADRPRPRVMSYRGGFVAVDIPLPTLARLEAQCSAEKATLFMGFLSLFASLLAHYTGRKDIAIGTPMSDRPRAEIESVVGCFVNTLVLRARIQDSETFRSRLHNLRDTCLAAYAHQELPFEYLVEHAVN
ncbi:MAG: condensation domain-containing protein, partial [Myxococcota bacterium]